MSIDAIGTVSSRPWRRRNSFFERLLGLILAGVMVAGCAGTPSPTLTRQPPSSTAPATQTPTSSVTPSPAPSPTVMGSPTLTPLPSQTLTLTPELTASRIPILEYHYSTFKLNDQVMMTPDWYASQIQWLAANGFTSLSAADLVDYLNGKPFPQKSVVLTFDIGLPTRADYEKVIIPALKEAHFKALFFLVINTTVVTDTCSSQDDRFCWDELRQWQKDGIVSVESHGLSHPDYASQTAEQIRWDAGQARKVIQDEVGVAPVGFAYPYDSVPSQAPAIIQSLGYNFALAGFTRKDRSVFPQDPDRFQLPRLYPYSSQSFYPILSGSNGKTFDQLIQAAIQPLGLTPTPLPTASPTLTATATATLTPTPSPTATPGGAPRATVSATPVGAVGNSLLAFCQRHPPDNSDTWLAMIDARAFTPQVSLDTQARLPMGIYVRPTCNFVPGNTPRAIVIHYTDGSLAAAVATFQKASNTSAHYIIDRNGTVVQMVQESNSAYHVTCYGYRSYCVDTCPICDLNGQFVEPYTQSIGIELVNDGHVQPDIFHGSIYEDYLDSFGYRYWEDYPLAQIEALKLLVQDIRARWHIPWDMVMGHYRVNNKDDPGPALNLFWPRYGFPSRPPIFDTSQP